MPVLSLACHLPHNTPHIPSRYNNEQTTKQTKAINNSYIYKYLMQMWHKPCRTFHPWCLCIKTRCLSYPYMPYVSLDYVLCWCFVVMYINCIVVYGRTSCKTTSGWWVILVKYVLIKKWNKNKKITGNIVISMKFSSLAPPAVVNSITSSAAMQWRTFRQNVISVLIII